MRWLVDAAATVVLDGWTAIASFVVLSLLVVRLVRPVVDHRVAGSLLDRRGVGPLGGAVLGAIPGCGGAIAVVSLYGRGAVGFGTLLAALIATAGDSTFVLVAISPRAAAVTYGVAFLTAVVVGVVVDEFGLVADRVRHVGRGVAVGNAGGEGDDGPRHGGRDREATVANVVRTGAFVGWWLAAAVGLAVGVYRLLGDGVPQVPIPGLPVGVPLFASALGVVASVGLVVAPERPAGLDGGRLRSVAIDTAVESAPIVAWVVVALAAARALVATVGVTATPGAALGGIGGAVVGGLLGVVPGCGVHVGFVTACAEGGLPPSALVANAISQDGDALFALVAVDRVAAVAATAYTAVAAVLVGVGVAIVPP
jgi:hypothetical protein